MIFTLKGLLIKLIIYDSNEDLCPLVPVSSFLSLIISLVENQSWEKEEKIIKRKMDQVLTIADDRILSLSDINNGHSVRWNKIKKKKNFL